MRTGLSRVVVPRQHRCKMNHNRISPSRLPSDRQPCSCLVNNMCFIYIYIYISVSRKHVEHVESIYVTIFPLLPPRLATRRDLNRVFWFLRRKRTFAGCDESNRLASIYKKRGGRGGEGEKKTSIFRKFHSRLPESRLPKKN